MADPLLLARHGTTECFLLPALANRHGLITGATGTGKTVTLQGLAESFAKAGVPVFAADVKGDLSGIAAAGAGGEKILARAQSMGIDWKAEAAPASFWDVMGQAGVPVRATLSEMGPLMLTRLLERHAERHHPAE